MSDKADCLLQQKKYSVNTRRTADVVYLDFSKTFGTVSHSVLLVK